MRVELRQERVIVRDVDDHEDVAVVLRRGADHRGAADVDILDHFVERRAAAQRVLERIEIDDEQVDRRDAVGDHRGQMRGIVADREQAAMHARMQGLQPPVHHLGKAGQRPDVEDRDAGSASAVAVPPVETISTPRPASARPSSTRPDLSETEISARPIGAKSIVISRGPRNEEEFARPVSCFQEVRNGIRRPGPFDLPPLRYYQLQKQGSGGSADAVLRPPNATAPRMKTTESAAKAILLNLRM